MRLSYDQNIWKLLIPLEISNCYLAQAIVCVCFGEKNAISDEKEFGPEIPKKNITKEETTVILEQLPDDPSDKMGNLFSYFVLPSEKGPQHQTCNLYE